MSRDKLLALVLAAGVAWYFFLRQDEPPSSPASPTPVLPCPPDGPCPIPTPKKPAPRPWGPREGAPVGAFVGGPVSPDGVELQIDLPGALHRRNTASRGLGNCVFTSIHHAALWQNVPALQEFPKWLIAKGIPGGGYPQKVADLIPKIAKDRGLPVPEYIQIEGGDLEMLKLATKTGRLPSITYSHSPTGRYGGQQIAHMVNAPSAGAGGKYWVILDNNYPGENAYEYLSETEFSRSYAPGWAVILLNPGPPPPPRSK